MSQYAVEWDTEANAAYIAFGEIGHGDAAKRLPVQNSNGEVVAVLDFAESGELLGIELLNAVVQLPKSLRSPE